MELPKFSLNFNYFFKICKLDSNFCINIASQQHYLANLRQIIWLENQYSLANLLNTSFYIYFTIHSCSNGQELVEKSSVPLCYVL